LKYIPHFIQEITKNLLNNVGVSFINKKAPVRRLFEPEAFHTENYTEIVPQTKKPP
jgi:hypothetical protein